MGFLVTIAGDRILTAMSDPQMWGVMLAGLGMLGVASRSRKAALA